MKITVHQHEGGDITMKNCCGAQFITKRADPEMDLSGHLFHRINTGNRLFFGNEEFQE